MKNKLKRFVVDEVHVVRTWGQSFRSSYLSLDRLKKNFARVPILGLTATATVEARKFIANKLALSHKFAVFQCSFNRPNLMLMIEDKPNISPGEKNLS